MVENNIETAETENKTVNGTVNSGLDVSELEKLKKEIEEITKQSKGKDRAYDALQKELKAIKDAKLTEEEKQKEYLKQLEEKSQRLEMLERQREIDTLKRQLMQKEKISENDADFIFGDSEETIKLSIAKLKARDEEREKLRNAELLKTNQHNPQAGTGKSDLNTQYKKAILDGDLIQAEKIRTEISKQTNENLK